MSSTGPSARPATGPSVLRDYALLADGERGALVGPHGEIAWLCFPRWDSPAVLSTLVGGAGSYQVQPEARNVWGGHYEAGTLIWRNRWTTDQGICSAATPWASPARRTVPCCCASITALDGPATAGVRLGLRPDFGRHGVRDLHLDDDGCWRGRLANGSFCWSSAADARVVGGDGHSELHLQLTLEAGRTHDLVLALDTRAGTDAPDATAAWAALQDGWRRRLPEATQLGHAARDVRHAHAVLHGLTSASGAMVAALHAVLNELVQDGYCYRFRQDDRPLADAEGAFLLCGFLLCLALLDAGDLPAAVGWFERTRAACGPPGLLTEEFDVSQRQLRGNLPQAFVHALLIDCAQRLGSAATTGLSTPSLPQERT